MKVKSPPPPADLKIDGETYPCGSVTFLHQKDPYPGGHHYELRISEAGMKRLFPDVQPGTYNRPFRDLGSGLGIKLAFLLQTSFEQQPSETQFFLNTIDEVTITSGEVIFKGECSEVVREEQLKRILLS